MFICNVRLTTISCLFHRQKVWTEETIRVGFSILEGAWSGIFTLMSLVCLYVDHATKVVKNINDFSMRFYLSLDT